MMSNAGSLAFFSYPSSRLFAKSSLTASRMSVQFANALSQPRKMQFFAVLDSSTSTASTETQDKGVNAVEETEGRPISASIKLKSAEKVPAKPLRLLVEEDVIPSLRSTLEAQEDVAEIQLSFSDNKLEVSFLKKGIPYTFWAFFPAGVINGPKCFSIASYGSGVSSVEPFLVDEKRPTAKLVVFWVEKRLAAQGIIPVWG